MYKWNFSRKVNLFLKGGEDDLGTIETLWYLSSMLWDATNLRNEDVQLLACWHFLLSALLCSFYHVPLLGLWFWKCIVKAVQHFTACFEALIIIFKEIYGFHSLSVVVMYVISSQYSLKFPLVTNLQYIGKLCNIFWILNLCVLLLLYMLLDKNLF